MITPWTVIDSTITYEDQWLRVRSDRCVTDTGRVIEPYHVIEYAEWVTIVALTPSWEIVLVQEYRHGAGEVLTGMPTGSVDPEDAGFAAAATRELREETGYSVDELIPVGWFYANPASQSNRVWTFLGLGARPTHPQHLDPNEAIEVTLRHFVAYFRATRRPGERLQGLHLASLWQATSFILGDARPHLDELRRALLEDLTRLL